MRRRDFVAAVGGAALWPLQSRAQQPAKLRQVGLLGVALRPKGDVPPVMRETLKNLGHVEGHNVAFETRYAEGKLERLPAMAAELVQRKVDLIVTIGYRAALAAREATSTIPIVLSAGGGDAVATGMMASLGRPGGNVTGVNEEAAQLGAKRLEILKETFPKATKIAVLWNADDFAMTLRYREIEKAARALRVDVQALGVREPNDFDAAFAAMNKARPDAMFLVADVLTVLNRKHLLQYAATHRIPAMYEFGFIVQDGGLMSYGSTFEDAFRVAATYADRILKGAKPAELPAQQPMRYYLAVNLKTAAALGVTIPQSILVRADDVIQ